MEKNVKIALSRLLMILFFALASVLTANFNLKGLAVAPAQADEDDRDENDSDDRDEDGGRDDDEEDNKKSDNEDEEDADENDGEDENERSGQRSFHNTNQRSGSDTDSDDEDENETDDDDEDEEVITRTTVNNPDGTRTEITNKVDGGETRITELTYDQEGNLIMEKKTEQEGAKGEVKTTTYDIYGNKLSQVEMTTLDGQVIKIETDDEDEDGDDAEADEVEMKYDARNQRLVIESESGESESRLVIAVDGETFTITQAGYRAAADFPMTVDEATGDITIQTSVGPIALTALPGTIVQSAIGAGEISVISGTEIEELDNKIVYTLTGTKFERLLGIFTVEIPVKVEYDGQTGQFIDSSAPFFSGILDLFSF